MLNLFQVQRARRATDFGSAKSVLWLFALLLSISALRTGYAGPISPPPDYGYQWSTITGAGNRPVNQQENFNLPTPQPVGSVDHEYRMARTEVTNSEWLGFVRAYLPYYLQTHTDGSSPGTGFLGRDIDFGFGNLGDPGIYFIRGNPNAPAAMSWEFAARYCNWLCNSKRTDRAAFENGAYDTSTFTTNPDGTGNAQQAHNPGAQFWLPTRDEWVKSVYWDPAKVNSNGSIGGYWRYPYSSNTRPVAALPDQGGQTNAGLGSGLHTNVPSVGSYPGALGPWGLLDVSGGVSEYTETSGANNAFFLMGSSYDPLMGYSTVVVDRLDIGTSQFGDVGFVGTSGGFRLASLVPTPGGGVALGLTLTLLPTRARRNKHESELIGSERRVALTLPRATDFGPAKSVLWLFALLLSISSIRSADAGAIPPDYGLTWKTIGAAGNRGTLPSEAPLLPDWHPSAGSVGYEFRLTQTEITRAQWLEFVIAYLPFYSAPTPYWTNIAFVGSGYVGGPAGYAQPNRPANMSWEYAARYCNWLQNGKASTAAAFAQGVYDTSTFTRNPDGTFNDSLTRAPDAKYWIPSLDEWTKGAYYDPNKHGPGQEGYWLYPNKSDEPLIPGLPSNGGQTNAGVPLSQPNALNAGSYPNVQSPWELLDLSGGVRELSDTLVPGPITECVVKGSSAFGGDIDLLDRLDFLDGATPNGSSSGLRLASAVPSPTTMLAAGFPTLVLLRRRRPCARAPSSSAWGSSRAFVLRLPPGP